MADRKTVNDVQMLDPKLVLDVKDRHGCLVTHSEKGWQLFSRPVDPGYGPFSYEVVTRATPDVALMDRIVQAEKEDVYEDIRTQVARLTEQLAELTGKVASANDDVDDRLTTLESSVSVLEDKIPGAVAKDGFDETPEYAEFSLSEVPEGINTVWDAADGQEIHRLANGGWIFGEDPEGEFGTAGELVYTPGDFTVYLFEPKDSEA